MCVVGLVFVETVGHTLCVVQECSWLLVADPQCAITRQTSTERTWPQLYWVESGESALVFFARRKNMVPRGLEPRTFRLLAERSNQLSYETTWKAGAVVG